MYSYTHTLVFVVVCMHEKILPKIITILLGFVAVNRIYNI